MVNDSLIDPSAINAGAHNGNRLNDDYDDYPYGYIWSDSIDILFHFTILISIFGILGNGTVIWLLGFRIKRSPFTNFILNFAVADFGVLVAVIMKRIFFFSAFLDILYMVCLYTFFCMFSTSQMFLTVISVDRCLSVFFPLWHRCHRPTWLPTSMSALAWLLPLVTATTDFISYITRTYFSSKVVTYLFIANGFLCIPLMTISSLMLFLKVCCISRQQRRQKLLITILITVSFFLFCCFPFNIFMYMFYLNGGKYLFFYGALFFACLNSSIKPLIYYLVGRRKEGRSNKSMKGIFQNLFKEEEI